MAEHFFGITDKGNQREKNEDTFIVQELSNKKLLLACVIDGVGGYAGGDVAASIARNVILKHLLHVERDFIKALRIAVDTANAKIRDAKKKNNKNSQMACVLTCVLTDITNNKFYYVHVGDTRLYLLRDRSLIKLSKDHSIVGFLEDSGRLSEEDAMKHPRRNEINKALGFEENINGIKDFMETGESPFLPGDMILLCSDGLSDMISSGTIMSVLARDNNMEEKAHELVQAANDAGGNDNITAVLVENNKTPQPQVALKPIERKGTTTKQDLKVIWPDAKEKKKSSNKTKSSMIAFSALLFLGVLCVLLFQKNTTPKKNYIYPPNKTVKIKNEILDQLLLHCGDSIKLFTIPLPGSVIKISEPILINKDSFHFKANGAVITPDSNYKGPALIIGKTAKHIFLDSMIFKDFDAGILVQKNNVVLKNVRFVNCRVPMEYMLSFSDSLVSGKLKDSIFIFGSTLKK